MGLHALQACMGGDYMHKQNPMDPKSQKMRANEWKINELYVIKRTKGVNDRLRNKHESVIVNHWQRDGDGDGIKEGNNGQGVGESGNRDRMEDATELSKQTSKGGNAKGMWGGATTQT